MARAAAMAGAAARPGGTRRAAAAAVALLVGVLACDGGDRGGDRAAPAVEPMTRVEHERGVEACRAYVERACACAAARPEQAEWRTQCDLGPGRVDALEMLFEVNRGEASDRERWITHAKARKMIAGCIEDTSRLVARGCPPPSP